MFGDSNPILMLVILAILVVVYFIPTWVASARKHHNENAILFTNLLLGWTFLGWVASLIWALTSVRQEKEIHTEPVGTEDTKKCPYCAETIKYEAKICRFCNRDLNKNSDTSIG